jgi:hypothetical protein
MGSDFHMRAYKGQVDPSVKRVIRIDPRDISRVYLEQSDGPYMTVRCERLTICPRCHGGNGEPFDELEH